MIEAFVIAFIHCNGQSCADPSQPRRKSPARLAPKLHNLSPRPASCRRRGNNGTPALLLRGTNGLERIYVRAHRASLPELSESVPSPRRLRSDEIALRFFVCNYCHDIVKIDRPRRCLRSRSIGVT
jgi:hypothetical protein